MIYRKYKMEKPFAWLLNPTVSNIPAYAKDMFYIINKEILQKPVAEIIDGEEKVVQEGQLGDYIIDVLWMDKEVSNWKAYRYEPDNPDLFFVGLKEIYERSVSESNQT